MIVAIDPGPKRSAWLSFDVTTQQPTRFGIDDNGRLIVMLRSAGRDQAFHAHESDTTLVIEKVESFGMPVGGETFDTVYWSGRFAEAWHPGRVERIGRKAIKLELCGTHRAKDPNVRQALMDRYGGDSAKGTKKAPGPLYGVSKDVWSALAVAVAWADGAR